MKKKDSFEGQKMIVLPEKIVSYIENNEITKDAYVTDIGYFPRAKDHFRMREKGSMQNILIYCVEGSGWISVNGERASLAKEQYCIIPKNTPHAYAASGEDPWTIYWLHFAGIKAERLFRGMGPAEIVGEADPLTREERIRLFDSIFYSLESEYSGSNLEYAGIVLMHLLGSFRYEQLFRMGKDAQSADVADRAIDFMKANLGRKIELDEIAAYCDISVSHFCLVFKKRTSHTPVEYLNNLRVQRACQLLDLSTMKVNEIADSLGFSDAFYFSRVFKKVMGQSPGMYRRFRSG